MATLADMKARIALELRRDDLTAQISNAISTAINEYRDERFDFAERRDVLFNTVVDQDVYTAADIPKLADLLKFDYVTVKVGACQRKVPFYRPIDGADTGYDDYRGEPVGFLWYAKTFRLVPKPSDIWQIRIAGLFQVAPPAADNEAGNPWMNEAEALIRSRAKFELALHVLRDRTLADDMMAAANAALSVMRIATNRRTATGAIRPMEL